MAHAPEALFIGGLFGSQDYVDKVCEDVSRARGVHMTGMTVEAALRDPAQVAERVAGSSLVSHSMGACATWNAFKEETDRDALPLNYTAIAAPIPATVPRLAYRGLEVGLDALRDVEHRTIMRQFAVSSLRGALHHNRSVRGIPTIARFNVCDVGATFAERGVPTRIVVMNDERFFDSLSHSYIEGLADRDDNLKVAYIDGDHLSVACDPAAVSDEIERVASWNCWEPQHIRSAS